MSKVVSITGDIITLKQKNGQLIEVLANEFSEPIAIGQKINTCKSSEAMVCPNSSKALNLSPLRHLSHHIKQGILNRSIFIKHLFLGPLKFKIID